MDNANSSGKVLIIGQPFDQKSGGGITITSLFKSWSKENILLATTPNRAAKNDYNICNKVYLLGEDEIKVRFPFDLFFPNISSKASMSGELNPVINRMKKQALIYNLFYRLFFSLSLHYHMYNPKVVISKKFLKWISDEKPGVIYTQLGHLEIIRFVIELKKSSQLPLVVHIMDDWPKTGALGIFKKYWQKKLDSLFRQVLNVADLCMSISEGMSIEYKERYNRSFIPFHYVIDNTVNYHRPLLQIKKPVSVFYAGRVGYSNINTIKAFLEFVQLKNTSTPQIQLTIYTPDKVKLNNFLSRESKGIIINDFVPNAVIKEKIIDSDVLLLPLDFDKWSSEYAAFSLPTKLWDYIAAERIILYLGPSSTYISKFIAKENIGFCVNTTEIDKLDEFLYSILDPDCSAAINEKIRNGRDILINKYNPDKMRERFKCELETLIR